MTDTELQSTFILFGHVTSMKTVEAVKRALAGKSYMDLRVEYGNLGGCNITISVSTAPGCEVTREELTNMILCLMADALAEGK
jgi:hypothetical protein